VIDGLPYICIDGYWAPYAEASGVPYALLSEGWVEIRSLATDTNTEVVLKRLRETLMTWEWIGETEPNKTLRVSGNGDEIDHVCNFLLDIIRTQRPHEDPWREDTTDTSPSIEGICILAHQIFINLFLDHTVDSSSDDEEIDSPAFPSDATSTLHSMQSKFSLSGKRTSLKPKALSY
jgi:hypothetical protein